MSIYGEYHWSSTFAIYIPVQQWTLQLGYTNHTQKPSLKLHYIHVKWLLQPHSVHNIIIYFVPECTSCCGSYFLGKTTSDSYYHYILLLFCFFGPGKTTVTFDSCARSLQLHNFSLLTIGQDTATSLKWQQSTKCQQIHKIIARFAKHIYKNNWTKSSLTVRNMEVAAIGGNKLLPFFPISPTTSISGVS